MLARVHKRKRLGVVSDLKFLRSVSTGSIPKIIWDHFDFRQIAEGKLVAHKDVRAQFESWLTGSSGRP